MRNIFLILFLGLFIGCGGGSSGTGTSIVEGSVVDAQMRPIQGAEVTVVGQGETSTAVTDAEGHFAVSSSGSEDNITIQVDYPDHTDSDTFSLPFTGNDVTGVVLAKGGVEQVGGMTEGRN